MGVVRSVLDVHGVYFGIHASLYGIVSFSSQEDELVRVYLRSRVVEIRSLHFS